ncbi:NAD(P)-dependent oxidoreductase [Saccharomonospora sp. NPDC046836]|uniref:NAD(P)-dependent oxidoreductase n=1 Tax=Saccharomonospora sp. NPDC046836 TaxID=3156921 RepID=UPI00340DAA1E
MRLGFIGAGRMGRPMVTRLIAAGHEVRALGRSADKRAALAAEGAQPVGEIAAAGDGADAVVVCVFNDDQVREVCLGSELFDRMPAGSVVVVHTTGSPSVAKEIAAHGAERRIEVIDSPVSGGPHDIAAGRVSLFVGGADDAVARMRPVLSSYGDPVLHVGPLGAGQQVKLINNTLFAANIGLLAEAVRVAGRLGVAEHVLLDALTHGSGSSRALGGVASRRSVAAFTVAVEEFLRKDIAVARKVAAELGANLGAIDGAINSLPRQRP